MSNQKQIIVFAPREEPIKAGDVVMSLFRRYPRSAQKFVVVCKIKPEEGVFYGVLAEFDKATKINIPKEIKEEEWCIYRTSDYSKFDMSYVNLPDGYRELTNRNLSILENDMYFKMDIRQFVPCGRSVGKIASEYFKPSAIIISKRTEAEELAEIANLNTEASRLIDIYEIKKQLKPRTDGVYGHAGILLPNAYEWTIKEDDRGYLCLVPLRHLIPHQNEDKF